MMILNAVGLAPAFDLFAYRLWRRGAAIAAHGLDQADAAALRVARLRANSLRGCGDV